MSFFKGFIYFLLFFLITWVYYSIFAYNHWKKHNMKNKLGVINAIIRGFKLTFFTSYLILFAPFIFVYSEIKYYYKF